MDERGVPRGGARPALWFSDAVPCDRRLGMNGRWTVQRAGSLARGRMKERSKSTQPRRIPVPSRPTRRPNDPQASPGGGVRGRGGGQQGSSPLRRLPRGVLGGWAALITGRFHWQRTLEPNNATERFSAASGPCCECESLFRDHEKEEGQTKQTDKLANSQTFPRHRHRVSPSARGQVCPSSTRRASFRRPSDSFECRLRLLLQSTCSSLQTTNKPACRCTPALRHQTHRYRARSTATADFFEHHRVVSRLCLLGVLISMVS